MDNARNNFVVLKAELKKLEQGPVNKEKREKIEKLRKSFYLLRGENNNVMGDLKWHSEAWANGDVDQANSFLTKNEDGSFTRDLAKKQLYNDVIDPSINLDEANIRIGNHPGTGERGYYYDPNDNRLALRNEIYKRNDQLSGEKIKNEDSTKRFNAWIKQVGKTTKNIKVGEMPPAPFKWISHKDLMGGMKLKDLAVLNTLNGKGTEAMAIATKQKVIQTMDADGKITDTKQKEFTVKSYDNVSVANEDAFYDIIMSPTQEGEDGATVDRDIRAGITYMSNNEIKWGNTKVNYREHSKLNPNITTLTYSKLGLHGSFGAGVYDLNDDGILEGDELTKKDKDIIHKKLMNPQTQQEITRELARYLNLQTRSAVENKRGDFRPTDDITVVDNELTYAQKLAAKELKNKEKVQKTWENKIDKAIENKNYGSLNSPSRTITKGKESWLLGGKNIKTQTVKFTDQDLKLKIFEHFRYGNPTRGVTPSSHYMWGLPQPKDAKEGGYYQHSTTGLKYQFKNGKYIEIYTPE